MTAAQTHVKSRGMGKNWYAIAETGAKMLGDRVPYGDQMLRREEVAAVLGVSRQTLRNYISARTFVVDLATSDPATAEVLRQQSATSVEVFSRWAKRDRARALAFAVKAYAEGLSVRAVSEAERADRMTAHDRRGSGVEWLDALVRAPRDPRRLLPGGRDALQEAFARVGARYQLINTLRVVSSTDPLSLAAGVEQHLTYDPLQNEGRDDWRELPFYQRRQAEGYYNVAGVVRCSKSGLADGYRRIGRSLVFRSITACTIYPLVILAMPTAEASRDVIDTLPQLDALHMGLGTTTPVRMIEDACALVTMAPCIGSLLICREDDIFAVWQV